MATAERPPSAAVGQSPEAIKRSITTRFAVRLHVALILATCFLVGLVVTKLLLMLGVGAMWLRYALALVAAYATFLGCVRLWLHYAGFDICVMPARGRSAVRGGDAGDVGNVIFSGGGNGGSGGVDLPSFRGGGGGSGGGGASGSFGEAMAAAPRGGGGSSSSGFGFVRGGSSGGSSSGGGIDLGDGGWVLIALVALVAAVFGGAVWILYAAPTILADAAFAALLSAGLVRSTRHITSGGWVSSVVGHTWIAFTVVFVMAMVFALVAQNHFPDAHTLGEVLTRL